VVGLLRAARGRPNRRTEAEGFKAETRSDFYMFFTPPKGRKREVLVAAWPVAHCL